MSIPRFSSFSELANSTRNGVPAVSGATNNTLQGAASAAEPINDLADLYYSGLSARKQNKDLGEFGASGEANEAANSFLSKLKAAVKTTVDELDDAEAKDEFNTKDVSWQDHLNKTTLFRTAIDGLTKYNKILTWKQTKTTSGLDSDEAAFQTKFNAFKKAFQQFTKAKPSFETNERVLNTIKAAVSEAKSMSDIITQIYAAMEATSEEHKLLADGDGDAANRQNAAIMEMDRQAAYLADAIRETAAQLEDADRQHEFDAPPVTETKQWDRFQEKMNSAKQIDSEITKAQKVLRSYERYQPYLAEYSGADWYYDLPALRVQDLQQETATISDYTSKAAMQKKPLANPVTKKQDKLKDAAQIASGIDKAADFWE